MNKTLRTAGHAIALGVAADAAAAVVKASFRPAAVVAAYGWRAVADMARLPRADGWLDGVGDAGERFALAADRHGVGDAGPLLRALWRRWAFFVLASAAWVMLCALTRLPSSLYVVVALLALAGQAAFYHFQVRTRRLARIGEWLRSPGEWVPPSSGGDGHAMASWIVVAIASLAALPGSAWAQATASGQAATDYASTIVNGILPLSGSGFASTGLGTILGILASTMGWTATALLTWNVINSVVATAHEGKVMGARVHQIWAPIRWVVGLAMVAPLSNGYTGGHALLYVTATQVNKVSNDMWSGYLSSMLGGTPAAANAPGIPPSVGGAQVAEEALRAGICAAVVSDTATQSGVTSAASAPAAGGTFVASAAGDGSGAQVWSWGPACGGLSLPVPSSGAPAPVAAFSTARIAAVTAVVQAVQGSGVAQQVADWQTASNGSQAFPSSILPTLTTAGQSYDQTMTAAAATLAANQNSAARSKLTTAAASGGWMQAFAFDRALAQASAQTAQIASQAPAWSAPKGQGSIWQVTGGLSQDTVRAYNTALSKLTDELTTERGAGTLTAEDLASAADNDDGYINRLLLPLDHRLSAAVVDWSAASASDPVGDLQGLGAKLSAAGEATSLASLGLSWVACNEAGQLTGACDTYKQAMSYVRPLIYATFGGGWLLQFWLPFTPFMLGLTLAVGWSLATLELAILVPVWALTWMRMEGQDLIEQQKVGLIIAFNWALRPPIALCAYAGVRTLIPLVYPLLATGFSAAWVGAQGGHYSGVLGTLSGVLVLSVLSYHLLLRLYSGILSIPDKLPRLLGLPGDGLDADAHAAGSRGVIASTGGAGRAGGGGGGGSGGGGNGGGGPKPPKPGGGGAPGVKPAGGGSADGAAAVAGAMTASTDGGHSGGGGSASTGSTGSGGREAGPDSWVNQSGGFGGLDAGQQAAAEGAYDNIVSRGGKKGEWAEGIGLDGYVQHVQTKQAERRSYD